MTISKVRLTLLLIVFICGVHPLQGGNGCVSIGYGYFLDLPKDARLVSENESSGHFHDTRVALENFTFDIYVGNYPFVDFKNVSILLEARYEYPLLIIRLNESSESRKYDLGLLMVTENDSEMRPIYFHLRASNVYREIERELIYIMRKITFNGTSRKTE